MQIEKVKKGKQKRYVNDLVKKYDEESVSGDNLFGDDMDDVSVDKTPYLIQLGNMRQNRQFFGNPQDGRVYSAKGCCITLTLCLAPKILIDDDGKYKVRDLSGHEQLTLMGVEEEDVEKIEKSGLSNGQMAKLAGNSIIVDVMSSFFKEMIKH